MSRPDARSSDRRFIMSACTGLKSPYFLAVLNYPFDIRIESAVIAAPAGAVNSVTCAKVLVKSSSADTARRVKICLHTIRIAQPKA